MSASQVARSQLMDRLVHKAGGVRSEATIQSDVRILLLDSDLGLDEVQLEAQIGEDHRRIDVEVGCTVIEVKRSLATESAIAAASTQLAGYVAARQREKGQRYVGIVTDGQLWIAFHEVDNQLAEATRHVATAGEAGAAALLRWLEGVLATKQAVLPTPEEIQNRLGADSSSHALDYATLKALYADHGAQPSVVLKRDLWANLLRSALGTQFTDSDDLFLEHTLLVNSAEIIAHLVLGLDVERLSPVTLLSGDQFVAAGLHGVVDRDFFDWVIDVPGGEGFIISLARRLSRFDWSFVDHDVLKVLYESVITPEVRKTLGEYYTPDWLANRIVTEVVTDPLNQRVLDPSCGSGTFLFYAVRRYLSVAGDAGLGLADAMATVSSRVIGIDLHPVAVALARVTYLLALGRERLTSPDRGRLSVPIYLGDSLGWHQEHDILSVDMLVIPTDVGDQLLSHPLRFPEHLLQDAARFDDLVEVLVNESGLAAGKGTSQLSQGAVRRLAIDQADLPVLNENFVRLRQLHEDKRDHVWSYYVRNVARPTWLSRKENRVDVLVGNPPWLSFRHMTKSMQQEFKRLARARDFWHRETTATHQDLAGLFVARAVERYLKTGGRLAFVVPNSVIDRDYWGGFRRGAFDGAAVQFAIPWDLRRIRPHMFPRGSAVIFGQRAPQAREMPATAVVWKGRAPRRHATLDMAIGVTQTLEALTVGGGEDETSSYHARFAQGAVLVPRLLMRVEQTTAGALGVPAGLVAIKSDRSASEKKPWRDIPSLHGVVERQFIFPTYLGEHVLPFRTLPPDDFVIPMTSKGELLCGEDGRIDAYPALADWTRDAEAIWGQHSSGGLTLEGQINYMQKLTQQFPAPPLRVVYAKAGMHVAAALVTDQRAVIDHKLYWGAVNTMDEGHYLVGVLNAPSLTNLVRPLMSYGKDERDIDKAVWKLPIPGYNPALPLHREIAEVAAQLTDALALQDVARYFVTARRDTRDWLADSDLGRHLDVLVRDLLGEPPIDGAAPIPKMMESPLLRITAGDLDIAPSDVEIDLDVEFDIDHNAYLWGYLVTADGKATYTPVGSVDPQANPTALADELHRQLSAIIQAARQNQSTVRLYHYGTTEAIYLRRLLGPKADDLLNVTTDLLARIRHHYFAGPGYGLKKLASLAGHTWRDEGMSGSDTYDLIKRARGGNSGAWEQLLRYNEDDTTATKALRQWLRSQS